LFRRFSTILAVSGNMTDSEIRRHGLESFLRGVQDDSTDASVDIRIQPGLTHLNLRGDAEDAIFLANAQKALGQALPVKPNTTTLNEHRAYWLGPDEWLLITESQTLTHELQQSFADTSATVNDVSGGQISLRITGTPVREILARGCTLDFHPDVFRAGMCAQSGLAKASVLIGLTESSEVFDIVVRRSFSDYVARWLHHSATAFGVTFSAS
jgi:sarcosine oxidase subunit gamma